MGEELCQERIEQPHGMFEAKNIIPSEPKGCANMMHGVVPYLEAPFNRRYSSKYRGSGNVR